MHPCPTCACHVRRADVCCPHCGARLGGTRLSASAALLALSLTACTGGGTKDTADSGGDSGSTTSPQPAYGITVIVTGETGTDTGTSPEVMYGPAVTTGTGDTGA